MRRDLGFINNVYERLLRGQSELLLQMMKMFSESKLSVRKMVEGEFPQFEHPLIIPDTSVWSKRFVDVPFPSAITVGIERELKRKSDRIDSESIAYNSNVFRPQVVTNRFMENDEELIYSISPRKSGRKKKLYGEKIGRVDAYQIALAMEHARELGDSVLLTYDRDIQRTVERLKKIPELDFVRESVGVLHVGDYLMKKHADLLFGLKGIDKHLAFEAIERNYGGIKPEEIEGIYDEAA